MCDKARLCQQGRFLIQRVLFFFNEFFQNSDENQFQATSAILGISEKTIRTFSAEGGQNHLPNCDSNKSSRRTRAQNYIAALNNCDVYTRNSIRLEVHKFYYEQKTDNIKILIKNVSEKIKENGINFNSSESTTKICRF